MDPEIEQLKELVRQQTKIIQDTNHMVHSMRRSQRLRTAASFVWWLLILAVSWYSYYYYLQPYVDKLEALYGQVQGGTQQAQNFEQQVQGYFNQYFGSHASSTSTTTP